jgi:hypothetical protein
MRVFLFTINDGLGANITGLVYAKDEHEAKEKVLKSFSPDFFSPDDIFIHRTIK